MPTDTSGIVAASPEAVLQLFHTAFGSEPDPGRLDKARIFAILDNDGRPAAAAAVETGDSWHLWLLAADDGHRGKGLGSRLIRHILDLAASEGAGDVRIKTFRKWSGMQAILSEGDWHLCGAEPATRYDGVREIWRHPIVKAPARLLVVGANPQGRGGEWLEQACSLRTLFRIAAVVDPNDSVRAHWESGGVPAFRSLEELANPHCIDAAVIAVPPMHVATIQHECIRLGIPYLVEKPMAASLAELLDLQRRLNEAEMGLAIGVQRRAHPSYVALKSALREQPVADLSIRIALGRPRTDAPSGHRADRSQCRGGALLDLGYHALDLTHFLLGRPLELVSCSLASDMDLATGIESSARILGRCGLTWVRLEVDRNGPGKSEEVRARTSDGVWVADRERVTGPDGSAYYECPGSWEKAEHGTLASLASLAATGRCRGTDLWEHLALFETVEQAYSSARLLGIEGFTA